MGPEHKPLSVRVGAASHVGKVRAENQDRIGRFRSPVGEVFVVVDGMGGHQGGGIAAQMTSDGLERHLQTQAAGTPAHQALADAAVKANLEVHRRAHSGDPATTKMGATAVLVLLQGGRAVVAHVGDSRAYLFRDNVLTRLTSDHTVVQRMLDHDMLTEEEARNHPDASVITRAFGKSPAVELEVGEPLELRDGDRLLLCSDGLCGYVDDTTLRQVLEEGGEPQATTDRLIRVALDTGGEDNVSVQLLLFQASASPSPHAGAPVTQRQAPRRRSLLSWVVIGLLMVVAVLAGVFLTQKVVRPLLERRQAPVEPDPAQRPDRPTGSEAGTGPAARI